MTNEQSRDLQRLYELYGQDESKWTWQVYAKFRCRIRRAEGLQAMELNADLKLGNKACPLDGQLEGIVAPHPAGNVAGVIAARDFPFKCSLCHLAPISSDFDIE